MTVEWTPRSRDRLADIYVQLALDEQRELVRHVEWIDARLADDPWDLGESRGGDRRIWYAGRLIVSFRLLTGGGVEVFAVPENKPRRAGG